MTISLKQSPLSVLPTVPSASTAKSVYSNFEHSAIAWNVVVKQLASPAINRSSGVHLPSRPPNSGGAVKWIALGAESDLAMPASPDVHQATTWCLCSFSIQYSGPCLRFPEGVVATPPTDF